MSNEQLRADCTSQLDKKLRAKEPRLAPGVRKYVRRLKQSGRWEEGIKTGQIKREEKRSRMDYAAEELEKTITEVICEDDPLNEASGQIKVLWLLSAVGELSSEERKEEMENFLDSVPRNLQPALVQRMRVMAREVERFMPLAG